MLFRSQGYGNRKGMVWLEVVRMGKVVGSSLPEDLDSYPHVAQHREEHKVIVIENDPLVDNIEKRDSLVFMRNIGGGGGHSLTVKNFVCHIELNKF